MLEQNTFFVDLLISKLYILKAELFSFTGLRNPHLLSAKSAVESSNTERNHPEVRAV